jgi:hypothetical protein
VTATSVNAYDTFVAMGMMSICPEFATLSGGRGGRVERSGVTGREATACSAASA